MQSPVTTGDVVRPRCLCGSSPHHRTAPRSLSANRARAFGSASLRASASISSILMREILAPIHRLKSVGPRLRYLVRINKDPRSLSNERAGETASLYRGQARSQLFARDETWRERSRRASAVTSVRSYTNAVAAKNRSAGS